MSELDDLRRELREVKDILQIQRVISGATLYSDLGDYARSESLFTADATLDYSYFFGPDAAALQVKTHWENVRALVPGFDATHHQVTNFEIDVYDETAVAVSLVRATLRVGSEMCTDGGIYTHDLIRTRDGWRIKRQVFTGSYHQGGDVIGLARNRARAMLQQKLSVSLDLENDKP